MDKIYSPEAIESACYETWENHNYFQPQGEGEKFCIMLPPPQMLPAVCIWDMDFN